MPSSHPPYNSSFDLFFTLSDRPNPSYRMKFSSSSIVVDKSKSFLRNMKENSFRDVNSRFHDVSYLVREKPMVNYINPEFFNYLNVKQMESVHDQVSSQQSGTNW